MRCFRCIPVRCCCKHSRLVGCLLLLLGTWTTLVGWVANRFWIASPHGAPKNEDSHNNNNNNKDDSIVLFWFGFLASNNNNNNRRDDNWRNDRFDVVGSHDLPSLPQYSKTSQYLRVDRDTVDNGVLWDALCRGCRHAMATDATTTTSERCGVYIQQELWKNQQYTNSSNNNSTTMAGSALAAAAATVAQRYPDTCRACYSQPPHSCDRRYFLYDRAAPRWSASHYRSATTTKFSSWLPHSLPTTATSTTEFFAVYNPSIVVLPTQPALAVRSWLDDRVGSLEITRTSTAFSSSPPSTTNVSNTCFYLVSFRVSNQNYCFPKNYNNNSDAHHSGAEEKKRFRAKDYLGLAIVTIRRQDNRDDISNRANDNADSNNDWHVLADSVVDVSAWDATAQDFRLVVLDQQIYISSNDWITPLWLMPTKTDNITSSSPPLNSRVAPEVVLNNYSGATDTTNRESSFFQVAMGQSPACASCGRPRGMCGKNINYFVGNVASFAFNSSKKITSHVYAEIWPTGPHMVRGVDLARPCQRKLEPIQTFIEDHNNSRVVVPSFATTEEIDFPLLRRKESILTRGRGGACCIPLTTSAHDGTTRTLLVGIQHSKTPSQRNRKLPGNLTSNHYLSSLYAFEDAAPFNIVAQSGWFCLGFPRNVHTNDSDNTLLLAIQKRKLTIGRTFECPRIHFVSGMTIKAHDPDVVIIAYGINDCLSHFVEVQLTDLEDLLFRGP